MGFGLTYTPAILILGSYFKRYRNLAFGIVSTGVGVGTFVSAPLVQYLIDEYTWRGAMLILSAILANNFVVGALMRPFSDEASVQASMLSVVIVDEDTQDASSMRKSFCDVTGGLANTRQLRDSGVRRQQLKAKSYNDVNFETLHLEMYPHTTSSIISKSLQIPRKVYTEPHATDVSQPCVPSLQLLQYSKDKISKK